MIYITGGQAHKDHKLVEQPNEERRIRDEEGAWETSDEAVGGGAVAGGGRARRGRVDV